MNKECLSKQELMKQLGQFTPAEKKEIREYLQRKNPLLFRLESRRVQCEIENNEKELDLLNDKILLKKEDFLELLLAIRKKRG